MTETSKAEIRKICNNIFHKKHTIWKSNKEMTITFSMTRVPPNRVTNSAGEATVKSLWRSIFLCSRPFFIKWRPDMLGLQWRARVNLVATQWHGCLYLLICDEQIKARLNISSPNAASQQGQPSGTSFKKKLFNVVSNLHLVSKEPRDSLKTINTKFSLFP